MKCNAMRLYFWDASALIKRYFAETGSDAADELFARVPLTDMVTTPWGYTETYLLLVRRRNEGILPLPDFVAAVTALQAEVVQSPDFRFLPVSDDAVFNSVNVIETHNLNATDVALLLTLLEYQVISGDECVLIACDRRFLRSAEAESVKTINPQLVAASEVAELLDNL